MTADDPASSGVAVSSPSATAPSTTPAEAKDAQVGGVTLDQVDLGALTVLQARLGCAVDPHLLDLALTHRSHAFEAGGLPHNERLEFLGDSVLGLVVTDALYTGWPDLAEGQLARLRAAVVNSKALAGVARSLDIGSHLRLGRGEQTSGGHDKDRILADCMEALLGAVYVDRGMAVATRVVRALFDPLLVEAASSRSGADWKTVLQEIAAERGLTSPEYRVAHTGPDHDRLFSAEVIVGGERLGSGTGRSKKEAEQQAAREAGEGLTDA